jgi:UV DNA damage repair endonuclease|tara:strand:+ start:12075 stop:13088 length:1014 start_codon:yes stop_codon:yes gene_type:complete
MTGRVGFACKYMYEDQNLKPKQLKEVQQPLNFRGTTIKWLRENQSLSQEKVYELIIHNLDATERLVDYVSSLPIQQRMLRLGSDMLPAYTEPTFGHLSKTNYITTIIADRLNTIGEKARANDVRLSMHPGQFCVLASDNPDIVERSIEEFEYHVDIARWLGYGRKFQDFKINVHISGRQGPEGIKAVLPRLSQEAKNCITIENEENAWGLDSCLELEKHVALVLDIHHHWCHSGGEYIEVNDDRVKRIIDSWRGVRPAMHYSVSREDYITGHRTDVRPDFQNLLTQGYKKAKLRAHSDYMWNTAVNEWAGTFRKDFDIMVEAKCKNLASIPFEEETR